MLNDMGIPSPLEHKRRNGGFYNGVVKEETGIWLKGAVRKILTDERYTGKMITNIRETEEVGKPKMRSLPRDQWIIVPGTHEAIISEELFRTAQNALQGRIRNVNKNTAGNRANNLFVCGCCGRKLRKNPAKEPHLVCPKNDSIKGAECAGLFVNQAQIEQAVLQMLREQSRIFLEQHCLMQACIDKKLSSIVVLDTPILDTTQYKDLLGSVITDIVLAVLSFGAQLEVDTKSKAQAEGIAAAHLKGVKFGRPRCTVEGWDTYYPQWKQGQITAVQCYKQLGISASTFYRLVRKYELEDESK